MTNQQIAANLQKILDKIETLQPEEFNFSSYVTKFDKEHQCGTVCCVLGWFPKWFPKSGIKWKTDGSLYSETGNIYSQLQKLTGCSDDVIEYLFYGKMFEILQQEHKENIPKLSSHSNLEEVKNAFKYIINCYEENLIGEKSEYELA